MNTHFKSESRKYADFDFKLPSDEFEFIAEFPGYLRCALECENGIATDVILHRMNNYIGDVGMCQIYRCDEGYFVVFYTSDRSVITTNRGVYNNGNLFHSIRSDTSLFVFEEDYSHIEEAKCCLSDVKMYVNQLREIAMLKKAVALFNGEGD